MAAGILKRFERALKKEFPVVGWLFGWHSQSGIVCVGCAASPGPSATDLVADLPKSLRSFPAGVEVVGIFTCGNFPLSEDGIADFFDQLLLSGLRILNETNEFCFLMQSESDAACRGYLHNRAQRCAVRVTVKVVDEASLAADAAVCRVRAVLPLTYETIASIGEGEKESVNEAVSKLVERIKSCGTAYRLRESKLLIVQKPKSVVATDGLEEDATCAELYRYVVADESETVAKDKKKKSNTILNWKMLFQMTADDDMPNAKASVPRIRYEHRKFHVVTSDVHVDLIVMVPKSHPVRQLASVFSDGVCQQLLAVKDCGQEFSKLDFIPSIHVHHFQPPECEHFVSVPYPKGVLEGDLETIRRKLHERLLLPEDRPLLRRTNAYRFPEDKTRSTHLLNPHEGLPLQPEEHEEVASVEGTYAYHHYMQDHFDDRGWGCAYRSLQTVISWFRHQGYTTQPVPTHKEIQRALVDVGDKPSTFVDSKQWIGSLEVSYCLQQLIGVTSKIVSVNRGTELASKARELIKHFKTQGTPIMIGGGVLAHTILGLRFNAATGDVKYLILDPHYTGSEDLHVVLNKGWCNWKNGNFWDAAAYYNLCLPQRPLDI